eukprot:c19592_g1_i1.p1 GENE.c19592_g1_i1~~c19592_g1_i1.p1  ORF type:complete len:356 (+),score=65.82 c19592_g1_i1:449-1516(+)
MTRLLSKHTPTYQIAKLACILHYFEVLQEEEQSSDWDSVYISYAHQDLTRPHLWSKDTTKLKPVTMHFVGNIEDTCNHVHADFANRCLGGGVFQEGCVQEEIRFVISPECLVSRMFVRFLSNRHAVVISGARRYSNHSGYARTFKFEGEYRDDAELITCGDRQLYNTHLTCFDALSFSSAPPNAPSAPLSPSRADIPSLENQHTKYAITRELNKALAASMLPSHCAPDWNIATGHWGCGVFGGERQLKFIIQWMAFSAAGRGITYFMFGHTHMRQGAERLLSVLERFGDDITVKDMYRLVRMYETYLKAIGDSQPSSQDTVDLDADAPPSPVRQVLGLFDFLIDKIACGEGSGQT